MCCMHGRVGGVCVLCVYVYVEYGVGRCEVCYVYGVLGVE